MELRHNLEPPILRLDWIGNREFSPPSVRPSVHFESGFGAKVKAFNAVGPVGNHC